MIIHNMPQRSEEWYAIRRGKFTASDFQTLMPSSRQSYDDWNDTQLKIIYRVAAERFTGESCEPMRPTTAMQWGIDTEDEARAAYEIETGNAVNQVGFVEYDDWIGCSPDGLIGDDGYLEIKCPNSDTHLSYIRNPSLLESKYGWQVIGGLMITGRKYAHIVSYDPRFKYPWQQIITFTVNQDEQLFYNLKLRLGKAIIKCKEIME